jgi:hypothetical protein
MMKEKEKQEVKVSLDDSNKKKTSFYAALYSCAGLMLALAVIIGFNRFGGPDTVGEATYDARGASPAPTVRPTQPPTNEPEGSQPDVEGESRTEPPADNQPTAQPPAGNQQATPPAGNQQAAPQATPTPRPATGDTSAYIGEYTPFDYDYITNEAAPVFGPGNQPITPNDTNVAVELPPTFPHDFVNETPDLVIDFIYDYSDETCYDCCNAEEAFSDSLNFAAFTDYDRMSWPVAGDVIMEYSTTALVFDPTLISWRVNPTLAISSPVGTEVTAAATGRVTDITETREMRKGALHTANSKATFALVLVM